MDNEQETDGMASMGVSDVVAIYGQFCPCAHVWVYLKESHAARFARPMAVFYCQHCLTFTWKEMP